MKKHKMDHPSYSARPLGYEQVNERLMEHYSLTHKKFLPNDVSRNIFDKWNNSWRLFTKISLKNTTKAILQNLWAMSS